MSRQRFIYNVSIGCAYAVGVVTFFVLFLPCLGLMYWFFPSLIFYFVISILIISFVISYKIIRKSIAEIDLDEFQRVSELRTRYPCLWKKTLMEHLKKPFFKYVKDIISGKEQTMDKKFLTAVERIESNDSSDVGREKTD